MRYTGRGMAGARRVAIALLCTGCVGTGCATLPDDPVERALYADLRQIVDTEERVGWIIDKYEVQQVAPTALQSVCQVSQQRRFGLLDWLGDRIEAEGGPAEDAYAQNGHDLDELAELLTLERMRLVLQYTDEHAEEECPFWYSPDPEFAGVQTDTNRFVGIAESMGGLMVIMRSDGASLGGGGGLRLLPGFGFSDRVTMFLGIEVGGSGAVSQDSEDEGGQSFSARPVGGVPLLLRLHDDTWVYDFEVTPLAQYYQEEVSMPPGFRAAFGVGIGSVRIGSIMPFGVGFLAYEFMPSFLDLPASHSIRIGTRVGLNYDP
jgi:hypothetical protein